jgi:hypothetical protein
MPIARVQLKTAAANATAAPSITMNSTPTAGNVIVMAYGGTTNFWIPPAGNIEWMLFNFVASSSRVAGLAIGIVKASASATITCAQASGGGALVAAEYSGLGGVKLDRQMAASAGSGTSLASGATPTTDTANALWVGCLFSGAARASSAAFYSALTNSFALVGEAQTTLNTTGDRTVGLTERIVSSTGTPNTGATALSSGIWIASVLALSEITTSGGARSFTSGG